MDIDTLVKDLMKAERMPLDKIKQKKQTLEWQRDDYRAMNTLLLDFRAELTQMKLSTKYRARQVSSSSEAKVTATASSAANQTSYSISKVSQLAQAETQLNLTPIEVEASKGLYGVTSASLWREGAIKSKTINVSESSTTVSVDYGGDTLKDLDSWSVSVNGKGYKVVTGTATPDENSVLVNSDGSLVFSDAIAKDSEIKIGYIANENTDSRSVSHDTTSVTFSQGSIKNVSELKLTRTSTKDGNTTTLSDVNFSLAGDKVMYGTTEVGTFNSETGSITFNDAMKTHLPPETPEDGTTYDYKLEMTYSQNYTTFQLDTHTSKGDLHQNYIVAGNESINNIVSKVNSSGVGVTMFFDSQTKRMSMTRTETGDLNKDVSLHNGYEMAGSGALFTDVMNFHDVSTSTIPVGYVTEAKNASFVINGLQTERTSNAFEMSGVTFNLKQTFDETDSPNPVSISVSNDSTSVFDNIVQFVNKYNELIGKIQTELSEERYRSYAPLTDDQRESLSDTQQEQWEEKAKSGLLRRDPILSNALSTMRMNFYTPVLNDSVSSTHNQLAKIGITTTANYLEGGKLIINEAELKKAIEADSTSVENLFRGTGSTDSQTGIINRLYNSVNDTMNKLKVKAGNSFSSNQQFDIGRQLEDVDKRIDRYEDRLIQIENRYWKQFTAMEKAIQQANSQSMYLMQQFSY
ncbi:flagellar hook protein [Bacillus sp. HMF5848]|nr:flagellar hook protein [Bacillus sp. HMF5848]